MKKLLALGILLVSGQASAFGVNLQESGEMQVSQLVRREATSVKCEFVEPRCIIEGIRFGIQYPGQSLEDVEVMMTNSTTTALANAKRLKENGFCK